MYYLEPCSSTSTQTAHRQSPTPDLPSIWNPTLVSRAASRLRKDHLLEDSPPEAVAYLLYSLGAFNSSFLLAMTELSRQKYSLLLAHVAELYLGNNHLTTLSVKEKVLLASGLGLLPRATCLPLLHSAVVQCLELLPL